MEKFTNLILQICRLWKPYHELCGFCSRPYDVILRHENLMLETQQMLKYFQWEHIIPPKVYKSSEIELMNYKIIRIIFVYFSNGIYSTR